MARGTGLAREQQRALDRLKRHTELPATYVAGGTAIAFHLAHRRSRDIDLFTFADVPLDAFSDLARDESIVLTEATDVALHLVIEGTPVDVVRYRYPLLDDPVDGPRGWPVAGLLDLSTMKLAALARRGLRRDFWDLRAIVESGITLPEAGEAYLRRFGKTQSDLYHVFRSLTFFDDAERDPMMPEGMSTARWNATKRFFERLARELVPR